MIKNDVKISAKMPNTIIQNIQTHFNICEDNPDNIRSILGSSTIKVAELKSFCKDFLKIKKLSGLKKKDFVEIIKTALSKFQEEEEEEVIEIEEEEDIELEPFEDNQEPDTIIRDLSNFEVCTDDDESDCEELAEINLLTFVDKSINDITNLCKNANLTIILVYSTHCEGCEKFMKKFKKFVDENENNNFNFGLLDIDTYTRNIGEIPEDEISELPAIRFYKNNECVKTMYKPTKGKIDKSIKSLTKKSSLQLKEECKSRGLSGTGKKEDLENRIKEDDEKGWNLHRKSKEELIDYLTIELKSKSKKYDEMDSISLIKKIRKISDKKLIESEMNFDKLKERFEGEDDIKKIMMKMTIKQLRVLIENGFLSTTKPSFTYLKYENDTGETIKALSKTEIISKFVDN